MNRGWFGLPTSAPIGPQPSSTVKLLDVNLAGCIPTSAANTRFNFMLPAGIIGLDAYFLDFRWATGPVNVSAGLVNNAGTSAPFVSNYTFDSVSAFGSFGGLLRYAISGRINTVTSSVMCGSTNVSTGSGAALATAAPPADRFRFYTDATDRILQGQLILIGTFR